MTYQETLEFLFEQLPIFQRQGASAYNKDLGKTIELCKRIGNPQNDLKFVHVAGTNGKGSTCHMLASVFKEAGYSTGLYTSPHLIDFRERCRVNGKYISKDFVVEFVAKCKSFIKDIKPSFFELTFAMSLAYFKDQRVDIVILETGMGGRLDSTNVVRPELSIITNIGFDHQTYLGNSIAEIASEKAGIIKSDIPVLLSDKDVEVKNVVIKKAKLENAPYYHSEKLASAKKLDKGKVSISNDIFTSPFAADYQIENTETVVAAYSLLKNSWNLTEANLISGLQNVQSNFTLLGRWQELQLGPKVICDVGHNEDGLNAILNQLSKEKYKNLHIVFGMVNDKNPNTIAQLPDNASYYLCQANIPRAMAVEDLNKHFSQEDLQVSHKGISVAEAFRTTQQKAEAEDLILVIGSLFVVAEVLALFE